MKPRTFWTIRNAVTATTLFAAITLQAEAQPVPASPVDEFFSSPARGFISVRPAPHWDHALLTGNGTQGAMVMGNPCDETIYLSHAALYLPEAQTDTSLDMARHLEKIRELCLAGKYKEVSEFADVMRKERNFQGSMDSFTGAFVLNVAQPWTPTSRYQRAVNFMTAEAHVSYTGETGSVQRSVFVSRADDVIVVRIRGSDKQTASIAMAAIPAVNLAEAKTLAQRVKSSEQGIKDGYLHFGRVFETNDTNPIAGYEGLGRVIAKGGRCDGARLGQDRGLRAIGADEILVLIKIRPLLKEGRSASNIPAMARELDALPADYETLLARHAEIHGGLMGRVSFSLNAQALDRVKPTEKLNLEASTMQAPLAQVERAFDAGRYHIICSTGYNPPNLQGLWSASVLAPWRGDFHMNADLQSAIAFLCMGNTPELMEPYFRFHEKFMPDFRRGMKDLYGMRGFFVPTAMTTRGRLTHFNARWPFCYWYTAAAWACQFYYDYWQFTGDRKFLEQRAYPLLKETAEFYEDFLTVTDQSGHVVFVPSYSPEQGENDNTGACINATADVGAAKQVLRRAIATSELLGRDAQQREKWSTLLKRMPPYEVGSDGSFREWLWPGLPEKPDHRHAMQFYPLYDEMPAEILDNPALVKAVQHSARARTAYHEKVKWWPPGLIFAGLAAAHTFESEVVERVVNYSVRWFWSTGMAAFVNRDNGIQLDACGSFPYLCASALVYSDPGLIRFFPARPPQWSSGSIKGVRLRGGITLRELTWQGGKARAVLVADQDQHVTILWPGFEKRRCALNRAIATEFTFEERN
jgi:alpha-L-fucosidase 2